MAYITRRGEYQWRARIRRLGYPEQSKTFETKEQAERWARALERELDQGLYLNRSSAESTTLENVLDRYVEEVVPGHKGGDVEKIRIAALKRSGLVKLSMVALTSARLSKWRDERLKRVSGATVRREMDILSAALNCAWKDWGLSLGNPVLAMRRPRPARARDRRLEAGEQERLMAALEGGHDDLGRFKPGTRNPWIKPLVRLALETAMRRGELLALTWEHVDLKARTAWLPDTKNGDARTVPLSREAIKILDKLPRSISGVVFPVSEAAVKKAFERACATAGIEDFRFHDLRHEATSRIAEKLDNILELSAVTGHRDVRMLKRYYHPKASELAKKLG